jgi:hypothetical protein
MPSPTCNDERFAELVEWLQAQGAKSATELSARN